MVRLGRGCCGDGGGGGGGGEWCSSECDERCGRRSGSGKRECEWRDGEWDGEGREKEPDRGVALYALDGGAQAQVAEYTVGAAVHRRGAPRELWSFPFLSFLFDLRSSMPPAVFLLSKVLQQTTLLTLATARMVGHLERELKDSMDGVFTSAHVCVCACVALDWIPMHNLHRTNHVGQVQRTRSTRSPSSFLPHLLSAPWRISTLSRPTPLSPGRVCDEARVHLRSSRTMKYIPFKYKLNHE